MLDMEPSADHSDTDETTDSRPITGSRCAVSESTDEGNTTVLCHES